MSKSIKVVRERKEWIVEDLEINPLSVARWFYKNDIKDIAIIQRLMYATFMMVLEKKDALLFTENWFAWSGGAVVESVFYAMSEIKNSDYKKLFSTVPDLKEEKALPYLEYVLDEYQTAKKEKNEYNFFQRTHNRPYEIARLKAGNDLYAPKIKLIDILEFNDWIVKF